MQVDTPFLVCNLICAEPFRQIYGRVADTKCSCSHSSACERYWPTAVAAAALMPSFCLQHAVSLPKACAQIRLCQLPDQLLTQHPQQTWEQQCSSTQPVDGLLPCS